MHEIIPGGSAYPVILGADISPDASLVASLSGIGGQRFVLTRVENSVNKVIFHRYVDEETREQMLVTFNAAGNVVYYNAKNGLNVYDVKRNALARIPLDGNVLAIEELPSENFAVVLSRKDSTYTVWILEDTSKLIGSFSFEAAHAFIKCADGALYVGKNMSISKIAVSRR
jgi:hypothetical protein